MKKIRERIWDRSLFVLTITLTILIAVFTFLTLRSDNSAVRLNAESEGTVTIHVYDPNSEYDDFGVWAWVKGGSGTPYTGFTELPNEEFCKEVNGTTNTAHSITVNFTGSEIEKFKSGTSMGFLICIKDGSGSKVWSNYAKETADVFIDISTAFDENNHADVYYLRKDNTAYTDVEKAKMALEKVTSARFTAKTQGSVSVEFEATSPITSQTEVELYKDGDCVSTKFATPSGDSQFKGSATFDVDFSFSSSYELKIKGMENGAEISLNAFIDDAEFIGQFENADTQSLEYGAIYTPEKTTFRVWAPFAKAVKVNFYKNGSDGASYLNYSLKKRIPEGSVWGGVWELDVEKDLKDVYYTYVVSNPGAELETIDPYAKAAGADGVRGMVCDLNSTDPDGWENDTYLYNGTPENADVPIVWELHVQDFSISPDSGMTYKGKYLAFTETGTTVPGKPELKTGVDYLKELGVTYVQLNPVYDFETVSETETSNADDTKDRYNWGYDPKNYNIPEGSYSTDPTDGNVRINEFKQMIMALHNAGIGVIMDVVYNHTYSTSGQALNDTVPGYYHRSNESGTFTDASGCGNETASERTMVRKYIIDSVKYWATEYHIDGFRFDLMGIHDIQTLNTLREELDALDDGKGTQIIMYGEPWSADGNYEPASFTNRVKVTTNATGYAENPSNNKMVKQLGWPYNTTSLSDRIAIFGDSGRDGLRGSNDPGQGWANGNIDNMGKVQKMMEGYCGSSGEGITTSNGTQAVAYASAHDNYTLWDQMCGKKAGTESVSFYNTPDATRIKQCKLIASSLMMSSGIVFMLAGDEMGRTKYGNHNSYNSVAKLNQIVWSRQETFSDLHDYYQTVIKMRKDNRATFSYTGAANVSNCTGNFTGTDSGKIVYETHDKVVKCELNANTKSGSIKVNGTELVSF